jgi:hypothetical protein
VIIYWREKTHVKNILPNLSIFLQSFMTHSAHFLPQKTRRGLLRHFRRQGGEQVNIRKIQKEKDLGKCRGVFATSALRQGGR